MRWVKFNPRGSQDPGLSPDAKRPKFEIVVVRTVIRASYLYKVIQERALSIRHHPCNF